MIVRVLSLIVCLLAGAVHAAAQVPVPDALEGAHERLANYLGATRTLSAGFRSILLDEQRAILAESSGRVALKRPGRFRWEYTSPSPSLLVADGKLLWSFDPELEQAVVRRIDEMDGANPTRLLGGEADLDRDFNIVGAYRADDVDWVEVTPKAISSDFDRIRLGFSEGAITMMELSDKLGQVTQILLEDVQVNQPMSDDRFEFEPPPGTDIVGAP